MTKIAVVGANGMLGKDLMKALRTLRPTPLTREDLDITNERAVTEVINRFDLVINCAAYTKVDDAETNQELAFAVNGLGPEYLARATASSGAKIIHVSTDYVFDGSASSPYSEAATPNPLTVYGSSKLAGEIAVLDKNPSGATLVRTSWLYGEHGSNFPRSILRAGLEKDCINVVGDQRGQPTWSFDVSMQIRALIEAGLPSGTFHATNSGSTTWFEFAEALFERAGWDKTRINRVTSADFARPAVRPQYSVLGHTNWLSHNLPAPRHWEQALEEAWDGFLSSYLRTVEKR